MEYPLEPERIVIDQYSVTVTEGHIIRIYMQMHSHHLVSVMLSARILKRVRYVFMTYILYIIQNNHYIL